MRIFATTPIHVGPVELGRRQARYDRLSPGPIRIALHDLPQSAPHSLDSEADVRRSEQCVADMLASVPSDEYDAAIADCVLDPGVLLATGRANVPVFGLLRLAAGFIAGTGRRWGAVTRNVPIAEEFERMVGQYGHGNSFTRVEVLDLGFDAIADDAVWNESLSGAVKRLSADGAEIIFNGCSAVDLGEMPAGVVVMDPTLVALHMLALGVDTASLPATIAPRGR
jgi:Asp/Glu/hydantoin racemase